MGADMKSFNVFVTFINVVNVCVAPRLEVSI